MIFRNYLASKFCNYLPYFAFELCQWNRRNQLRRYRRLGTRLARANPLPYSKPVQIGMNICETNTKPWNKESRISNPILRTFQKRSPTHTFPAQKQLSFNTIQPN